MLQEVILHTANMFDEYNAEDRDYNLWKSIAEYMDGEKALVADSKAKEGEYVFIELADAEKDKELFWMMEQDSMIGVYTDDRTSFDADWKSGEYEPGGCFYLEKKYIEFI